jgi:hypothetical protein
MYAALEIAVPAHIPESGMYAPLAGRRAGGVNSHYRTLLSLAHSFQYELLYFAANFEGFT